MRFRASALAAPVVVGALLLGGCAGDSDPSPTAAEDATGTTEAAGSSDDNTTEEAPDRASETEGEAGDQDVSATDGTAPDAVTEPAVDYAVQPPVSIDQAGRFDADLEVTVTSVDAVDLEAMGPGQTAGPGALVALEVRNSGDAAVDLAGVVVNARDGEDRPAAPHFSQPADRFDGRVAPGETATATYAFRVPHDQIPSLVFDIHHDASPNVVIVEVGD